MVEDALINTDIDRVISVLSRKKRVELEELSKDTDVPQQTLKNWLHTLEEEGYVKLEYRLTKIFVVWLLDTGAPALEEERREPIKAPAPSFAKPTQARERELPKPSPISNIVSKASEVEKDIEPAVIQPRPMPSSSSRIIGIEEVPKISTTSAEIEKYDKIKGRMNGIFSEINELKKNLSELESQKQRTFQETLGKMDKIAETSFDKITDKTLQIEENVLNLKEHIMELMKTGEISSKTLDKLSDIKEQSMSILMDVEKSLGDFRSSVSKDSNKINAALEKSTDGLKKQISDLHDMESYLSELENNETKLSSSLTSLKDNILSLMRAADDFDNKLIEIREKKAKLSDDINFTKVSITRKEDELNSLKSKLSTLKDLETFVANYIEDYKVMLENYENRIRQAEIDAVQLRKSAEVEALAKYLEKLDDMTSEMEKVSKTYETEEEKLEKEIAETKDKMRLLIKESKDLANLLKEKELKKHVSYDKKKAESMEKLENFTKDAAKDTSKKKKK